MSPMQQRQTPVVISLGGSMLYLKDDGIDVDYMRAFEAMVLELRKSVPHLAIVVGGGRLASEYATKARAQTKSEFFADRAAIKATRENAAILIRELNGKACPKPFISPDEAAAAVEAGTIAVGGGFLEGLTTDACSVIVAERIGAKTVVNVSHVDGVYDSDPRDNPSARKFDSMTHAQLVELAVRSDDRLARTNFVFDLIACKLAQRSNITLQFVKGSDLSQVRAAILGGKHDGTVVKKA